MYCKRIPDLLQRHKVVVDSGRYLDYATGLRSDFYIDPFNIWYIGYSIFVFMINVVGVGLAAIVGIQLILLASRPLLILH